MHSGAGKTIRRLRILIDKIKNRLLYTVVCSSERSPGTGSLRPRWAERTPLTKLCGKGRSLLERVCPPLHLCGVVGKKARGLTAAEAGGAHVDLGDDLVPVPDGLHGADNGVGFGDVQYSTRLISRFYLLRSILAPLWFLRATSRSLFCM